MLSTRFATSIPPLRARHGPATDQMLLYLRFLALIGGLILMAAVLSLYRHALRASNRWQLRGQASRGDRRAAAALRMADDIERFNATARLGALFAAILAGVTIGVWVSRLLEPALGEAGTLAKLGAGGAIIGPALAVILLVDLLPRRLAAYRPARIACALARPMSIFGLLASPLAGALGRMADVLARRLGIRPAAGPVITAEEIKQQLQAGVRTGVFEEAEHEILKRAFRFLDRRARALMTPRGKVVWIDLTDSPEEVRRKVIGSPHSRFPVCDQSLDNLLGIIQVKDLLAQSSAGPMFRIKGLLTLPLFIFEGARGPHILETLRKSATHTAVVLDEYGSVVGLLTLNNILEALLGDLPETAGEEDSPRSVQRPDGSWSLDGRVPLDEFRELLELVELPEGDFHTLGGLVVTQLGHIPRVSESFEYLGLRFEVVEMDGNRVDRVLVGRSPLDHGAR
jgi:putative hemolysin